MTRLHALIAEFAARPMGRPAMPAPRRVMVGIETDRGPWVAALLAAGYQVFAINPLSAARYRERHSTSGAKSDAGDAHVLAEIVRLDRAHHRQVAGDTRPGRGGQAGGPQRIRPRSGNGPGRCCGCDPRCGSTSRPRCEAFEDLAAKDALELLGPGAGPGLGRRS